MQVQKVFTVNWKVKTNYTFFHYIILHLEHTWSTCQECVRTYSKGAQIPGDEDFYGGA